MNKTGGDEEKQQYQNISENAQIGYQVAVSLWTYQGSLNWNRFNVMLTANTHISPIEESYF